MQQHSDGALITLALSGVEQGAFTELVNRHQQKLRYSLRQLTNWDEALADDLAQETFIQAFKHLAGFKGKSKFSSWLYRIGYNCFLQHVRKKRPDEVSLDAVEQMVAPASQQSNSDDTQLHRELAHLLSELGPERRSVLHLFLYRQHSQSEIAEIMDMPLGTVKTHVNRGKAELRQHLAAWQDIETN